MNNLRSIVCLTLIVLAAPSGLGGEYNRVLSLGDAAPSWTDLPGIDGQTHSLEELDDAPCLVVAFTCNSCPYATDVEDRLIALNAQYHDQGMRLVAINVNQGAADGLEAMTKRAEEKGFTFQYLFDSTQRIGKEFGATRTPEFFVFDQQRRLVYQGALDDSPEGRAVNKRYVAAAIDAVLKDEPLTVKETAPVGCNIRYARNLRRPR